MCCIAALKGSWLERQLAMQGREYRTFSSKEELIGIISENNFDIFISNGCPYILPVSSLRRPGQRFINIHPSPLPDLRGRDPIPGALLFGRDSGATCHEMDDGIDSGAVIAQSIIPCSDDLDAPLLYQLSFLAEKEVFNAAIKRDFAPLKEQKLNGSEIYYSVREDDRKLDFSKPAENIVRQIKAFANRSQGVSFSVKGVEIRCFEADVVTNEYLVNKIDDYRENEVAFKYEDTLIIRKADSFLRLKKLLGDISVIAAGDILT